MGAGIPHARGGAAADEDCRGAFDDGIRRADAGDDIAEAGGGQAADEDGGGAWRGDGTADMRHQHRHHRADVHVSEAGCGKCHIVTISFSFGGVT